MSEKCPFCGKPLSEGELNRTTIKKPIYKEEAPHWGDASYYSGPIYTGKVLVKGDDYSGYTIEKEVIHAPAKERKKKLVGHEDWLQVEKYIGCDACRYKLAYVDIYNAISELQPRKDVPTILLNTTSLTDKDVFLKFFTAEKEGGIHYRRNNRGGYDWGERFEKLPRFAEEGDYVRGDDTRYFFKSKLPLFEGFAPKGFDAKTIYEEELAKRNAQLAIENKKRTKKLTIIGSAVAAFVIFALVMLQFVIMPAILGEKINAETVFLQADKTTASVGEDITLTIMFTPDDATHVNHQEILAEGNLYNCDYRFTQNNIGAKINGQYEKSSFTKKQVITISSTKAGTVKIFVKICYHEKKHDGLQGEIQSEEITLTFI